MARSKIPYTVGAAVAVAIGIWVALGKTPNTTAVTTPTSAASGESASGESAPSVVASAPAELAANPLVLAYQAYSDFQQHSRGFFAQADTLSEQERQAQLRQLLDGTNKYEQEGKLVPMEALVLKLAMLRYSSAGDEDYQSKATSLIDQYKALSDAREQAWLANPDPKFIDYKRQENDIVKEVMAMTVIPDGLSRDEYLRQRLEQARIATMGSGNGP